ncbi:hypothetical protein Q361_1112 [Flavobacterium croceum DSM 17960]|uniref:Uncharacterized protein n=1 Tax=Flavobacterium croceum DSM 17960 TaxID=1121886 RepID=A0A2S4N6I9_9FLAO|nr:hypothetical protein [Flavobacterium croceum]POS01291.1 hypothetical protein Q361_1112 [Flavobacterium croceum DSM 17960]
MELTEEERYWCPYEKNQILIFKSNLGNFDTLQVDSRVEDYTNKNCNCIEVSFEQLNYIEIGFSLKSKTKTLLYSSVSLMKNNDRSLSYPELSFFGLTSAPYLNGKQTKPKKIKLQATNKFYENTYKFEEKINAQNVDDGYLSSFYYDRKNGLVKYIAKDGEIFELIKK